jgi:hypothetical protein
MRLSVRKNDPGYNKHAVWAHPYLDGKPLKHCVTADEETGEAWVFKTDENGRPMLNEFMDELPLERLTGSVEIRFPEGAL